MLPPERRLARVCELIERRAFFVLAAGRQTGKTTSARWLEDHYRVEGRLRVLWIDLETAHEKPDVGLAMRTILDGLSRWLPLRAPDLALPDEATVARWLTTPDTALSRYLQAVSSARATPVVWLFDGADCLVGPAMVSFLTQLRALYLARPSGSVPHSVALLGMRAVRDFALSQRDRAAVSWLGTSSPFNVTAELTTLLPFTPDEVRELLGQHTADTGQHFDDAAVERVEWLSQGQPWLVNALADHAIDRQERDRSVVITAGHIDVAKEALIAERRTHIDSLVSRLREERVRSILDPMLAGIDPLGDILDDDVAYLVGMGLCRIENGRCEIANPIYREVVPRALTYARQVTLYQETAWYLDGDGLLDVPKLMGAWQTFWRKDGHLAAEGFSYKESGPHLMLMAFLQRVVNGGGRIEREYALGKGALDLLLEWKTQRVAIEVKRRRDTETEDEALAQVGGYLDSLGLREGWLVIFDLRSTTPQGERQFVREREFGGCLVRVVGC